jgi:hypothetical protein
MLLLVFPQWKDGIAIGYNCMGRCTVGRSDIVLLLAETEVRLESCIRFARSANSRLFSTV